MTNEKESKTDQAKFEAVKFESARALIEFAQKKSALFTVWSKGQKYSAHGQIIKIYCADSTLLFTIARTEEIAAFEKKLESEGVKEALFTVNLPTDVVFFKGEVRRGDLIGMNFKLIDPLYRTQRREGMRLPILESEAIIATCTVEGEKDSRRFTLHDLSVGGVGFLEDQTFQKSTLQKGMRLENFSFTIRDRTIKVSVEVLFALEVSPNKKKNKTRYGGAFRTLSAQDRDFINAYVVEKSSRFFGRI